jgi:hypothetical protein
VEGDAVVSALVFSGAAATAAAAVARISISAAASALPALRLGPQLGSGNGKTTNSMSGVRCVGRVNSIETIKREKNKQKKQQHKNDCLRKHNTLSQGYEQPFPYQG